MAIVYVSSTFDDLKLCRAATIHLLRRMQHQVVTMEDYTAENQWPADKCLADVAGSDLYVGLFAWRYGYIPGENNPKQLSITEMEYEQAVASKKECLIFILREDAPWPRTLMDRDPDRIERLRGRLVSSHICDFFSKPEELPALVSTAVANWAQRAWLAPSTRDTAFDLGRYYTAMTRFYQQLELEALTQPQHEQQRRMQLSNIFVEPSVREDRPPVELTKDAWERLLHEREITTEDIPREAFDLTEEERRRAHQFYFTKPKRPVLEVVTDPQLQHVVLIGDPGSGKSTLARYIMLSLIGPPFVQDIDAAVSRALPGHLPLLIELRSFAALRLEGKCDTFLGYLNYLERTEGRGLREQAMDHYLANDGRAVVIIDGLDEIFDPEAREAVARQIIGFAVKYPKVRILATSRVIGFPQRVMESGGFAVFTLQDLDESQVGQFVDRWYKLAMDDRPGEAEQRRARIMRSFAESVSMRQLAGNPMLLTIMAIIGTYQELPRQRWKLYSHAAGVLLEHLDFNKHLHDRALLTHGEFIGEDEKKQLLQRLAYRMQSGEGGLAGNFIHKTELEAECEQYLKDDFGSSPADARAITRVLIKHFRDRNFILCFRGANSFGFIHRAFLEFFCASAFLHFRKAGEISPAELQQVFVDHWKERSWNEVLRLISGMVGEKFAGKLIEWLLVMPDRPKLMDYSKQRPWNLALGIQCLSELQSPHLAGDAARAALHSLCEFFDGVRWQKLYYSLETFLDTEVVPAVERIGPRWPHREVINDWLRKQSGFMYEEDGGREVAHWELIGSMGRIVGLIGAGSDETHQLILERAEGYDETLAVFSMFALTNGWKDEPRTLSIVQGCLKRETRYLSLHEAAIQILATYFSEGAGVVSSLIDLAKTSDDWHRGWIVNALAAHCAGKTGMYELFLDRAIHDGNDYVRRIALGALTEHYAHQAGILELLRERAVEDPDASTRSAALKGLASQFGSAAGTLELLRERAISDTGAGARSSALEALADNFRHIPGTRELLQQRAVEDPDAFTRSTALGKLSSRFRHVQGIDDLLRRRAVEDPHARVRSDALTALARDFGDIDGTFGFVCERAIEDRAPLPGEDRFATHWAVRRIALDTIAQRWPSRPETLELLKDRAEQDPTPWLREDASKLAASLNIAAV